MTSSSTCSSFLLTGCLRFAFQFNCSPFTRYLHLLNHLPSLKFENHGLPEFSLFTIIDWCRNRCLHAEGWSGRRGNDVIVQLSLQGLKLKCSTCRWWRTWTRAWRTTRSPPSTGSPLLGTLCRRSCTAVVLRCVSRFWRFLKRIYNHFLHRTAPTGPTQGPTCSLPSKPQTAAVSAARSSSKLCILSGEF